MRLTNRTDYQTADLRAILSRVAQDELADCPDRRKALEVEIVVRRGPQGVVSGLARRRAWRGGEVVPFVVLKIPRRNLDPVLFAWLCGHELAHIRGMSHRRMSRPVMHFTDTSRAAYAWAAGYPVRLKEPAPAVPPLVRYQARLEHARTMLQKADTRLKRATTIRRRWAGAVRDLERRVRIASALLASFDQDQEAAGQGEG